MLTKAKIIQCGLYFLFCGGQQRGHDHKLIPKLVPSNWSSLLPPLSLECTLCPPFLYSELLWGGHSFGKLRCFWDHLDRGKDWSPYRLLYKFLGFQQVDAETYLSCSHSRQTSDVSFLAYWNCYPPVWSGHSFSSMSWGQFPILPESKIYTESQHSLIATRPTSPWQWC